MILLYGLVLLQLKPYTFSGVKFYMVSFIRIVGPHHMLSLKNKCTYVLYSAYSQ